MLTRLFGSFIFNFIRLGLTVKNSALFYVFLVHVAKKSTRDAVRKTVFYAKCVMSLLLEFM